MIKNIKTITFDTVFFALYKSPWPIYFELPNGEVKELYTDHGDAVLYKGMEVDHWRNPLKGTPKVYYHQIFMHFVRADGYHVEYAYDTKC